MDYVSRAGQKLEWALGTFDISVGDFICADFGCSTGGFTDCLLQAGALKVYAVDTGKGVLEWKLRTDERVVVMEGENAMHVTLPEPVDLITIDTGWTKLEKVVPNTLNNLKKGGHIIALVKPHYEAGPEMLRRGKLPEEYIPEVLERVRVALKNIGVSVIQETESPLVGGKGKNKEYLFHVVPGVV